MATARARAHYLRRRALRALRDAVIRGALGADPTPALLRRTLRQFRPTTGVLCCVARRANERHVRSLVAAAALAGLDARVWWLDGDAGAEPVEVSGVRTVGRGPGTRQELLNRLLAAAPLRGEWVVLADDDVALRAGADSLARFLSVAATAGFDLAQPAHDGRSRASSPFVRARPGLTARRTAFVEIGPLVAVSAAAAARLLPLDEDLGMGWGQDHRWADAAARTGLRLGIVDAVRVRHLGHVGATYDADQARATLRAVLSELGRTDARSVRRTIERWPAWRDGPPWEV